VGCLFVFSGLEKLLGPYQNFLFVVETYDVVNTPLEMFTARVLPWVELLFGAFVLCGLWLRVSLTVVMCMSVTFMIVVGQAILRKLPITDCGCFGESFSPPLEFIILFDAGLFILALILLKKINLTSRFSLDQYYSNCEKT